MRDLQTKSEYPLSPIARGWMKKIRLAQKFKKDHFQEQADEAMKFFECGKELNDLMWGGKMPKGGGPDYDDEGMPAPKFRMVVGKVAEIVELFGPSLYHRNPDIIVEPKTLDIPLDLLMALVPPETMQQAQMAAEQAGQQFDPASLFPPDPNEGPNKITALLLQYYLNYMQRENDKKTHSRRMIDEALIKGMGVLWTESFQPYHNGPKLIGSFYDTVDNLVIDPDAETIEEALWIARKCTHAIWQVAEEYGISEKFLKEHYGTAESATAQGETEDNEEWNKARKVGKSNDLIEYWKVYSKMGMGHKLANVKDIEDLNEALDSFGDNCYIVVADSVPYPLNFSQDKLEEWATEPDEEERDGHKDAIFAACQWPIPFWADGSWPFTYLAFHEVPNNPWPMSHVKPALGYLKFINWAMSFLSNKIRTSCRTIIAAAKALDEEWRHRLSSGKDYEILDVSETMMSNGSIDVSKLVQYVQPPPFQGDIWKVLEAVFDLFDKATGLTELMYASSGGMRSAQEAQVKQGAMNVRPDDMASKVEDCMSLVARKEAMAARWLLDAETVAPVLDQRGAALWERYVMSGSVDKVAREFSYRVEAGSARKPNKETQIANINQAIQVWGPILFPVTLQQGQTGTVNAFLEAWCNANDIESKKFLLPQPPPPPPNPMQQKIEAEIEQGKQEFELKKQEFGLKREEMGVKLQFEQQKSQMELQAQQAKTQGEIQAQQMKTQSDVQQAQMKMHIEQQKAKQQLQLGQMTMLGDLAMQKQEMGMKAAQGEQQLKLGAAQGAQQLEIGKAQSAAKIQAQKQQAKAKPKPKGKK